MVLWLLLLAGCGDPAFVIQRPFREPVESIQIGHTTRSEVHDLLGLSYVYDRDPAGKWDVFRDWGDGIGLLLILPVPRPDGWRHYLLVTYDEEGRVNALGTKEEWSSITESDKAIFAGRYGYYTGLRQAFPSIDGGGKADSAWAAYLKWYKYHLEAPESWAYGYLVLKRVCQAANRGHPCAFKELGNYFWEESYDLVKDGTKDCNAHSGLFPKKATRELWSIFEKNNVRACVWYSMANDKVLTPWCRNVLSADEILEVEQLLMDWQPSQCENELAPYICGKSIWSYRLCE